MGKSLWKKRHCDGKLYKDGNRLKEGYDITIPIHREVDKDSIVDTLYKELGHDYTGDRANTIHLDISHKVMSLFK